MTEQLLRRLTFGHVFTNFLFGCTVGGWMIIHLLIVQEFFWLIECALFLSYKLLPYYAYYY